MTLVDQSRDPGYSHLRVLVEKYPNLRDFCKQASLDTDELSALPDSAFADSSNRTYPIHTKEHAALSIGYRKLAYHTPELTDERLEKAAEVYSLPTNLFEEASIKIASEEFWLLPSEKRFRITSDDDVKLAEQVLTEKYACLSVDQRAEAFGRLGEVAEKRGVALSPSTKKLAGFTMTSTKVLRDWLDARKSASTNGAVCEAYDKIASAYTKAEYIQDRYTQIKLAQTIHDLDKRAELTKFYGTKLPDPLQTVFNTTKTAGSQVPIGTGFSIDRDKLATIPLSFWSDVLGPDVVREISPDGQNVDVGQLSVILGTMPAEILATVQKQLSAYK